MATISELAQMSSNAYSGAESVTQDTAPGGKLLAGLSSNWTVYANSNTLVPSPWKDGYFGVAYYNTATHEVVIANRGTDWADGAATAFHNLLSDAALGVGKQIQVQVDAAAFADQVLSQLLHGTRPLPITSVIETGHSLGGTEAQAAVAYLVENATRLGLPSSAVSGVVFNSPGLAGYRIALAAAAYNVIDLYDQGDAVHLAGGTHLGGAGNLAMLAAGPNTSSLAVLAPAAIATGPIGILALLANALYDIVGPAHSINTIIPYIGTRGDGSATGAFNWTSSSIPSQVPSTAANPSLPAYSINSSGNLSVSDPISGVTATFNLSSINGQTVSATFSGGSSALAQALDSLGVVTVPLIQVGSNLGSIAGSSLLSEAITRNASNNFDVTFQNGGTASPNPSNQYVVTATNSNNAFAYAVPGASQILVETIDDGVNNSSGSIEVLGATAATLAGGSAVPGQSDTWIDANGDVYSYTNFSLNNADAQGTLTISKGLLGTDGNEIVIDNFNLATAQTASGYMGIVLSEALTLNASANAGIDPPAPNYIGGSSQSYTLSVNAPSTTTQIATVTLTGASPTDFVAVVGSTVEQLSANGSFNVTLAGGATNVAFTLLDVTSNDGSSDIASGAALKIDASLPNPNSLIGGSIQPGALTFNYLPAPPDTGAAPQNLTTIAGTLSGGVTNYQGDGGNDYIAAGAGPNYINAINSINDSIVGGTGSNTIYGGSGNDVTALFGSQDYVSLGGGFNTLSGGTGQDTIYTNNATAIVSGNNGQDVIVAGDGTNEIYAGAKTSLANAIAAASTATATGQKGDLIAVGDGDNTIVGSNGNDLIATDDSFQNGTGGNDVIVLGAGNDTYLGGTNVTAATGNWTETLNGNGVLTPNNISIGPTDYSNPYPQPYNGNYFAGASGNAIAPFGAGNVTIFGGKGNYDLLLGNGNNFVEAGSGNSTVYGGMGNDTIIAGSGIDVIRGGGGTTYIKGGSGTSTLTGGDGDNTIIGGSGNSTIYSSSGPSGFVNFTNANLDSNYVYGGSGNDLIYGSAGSDILIAGTGNTTIRGQFGNEEIVGGSGNDFLTGGIGNNTIEAGGSGLDTLYAGGSSSSTSFLYGGSGVDYIVGGSGTNIINAGDGGTAGTATSVFASQGDATATTTIYGGSGVDFLEAGAGNSVVYGGNGGTSSARTTLIGFTGADTLIGGLGTDVIYGGTGGSDVLYAGDGGTTAAPTTVISGSGIDSLYGGGGSSVLQDVTSGRDLLVSGSANDTLIGTGNDTLIAGTGNDILQANGGSVDIQISAGFGNDTVYPNGGTENLLLGSGILATDLAGSITFDASGNGYLSLSGDGGSIAIEDGLTGALAGSQYVGGSSIPLLSLITDALGSDQTVTSSFGNFIVNLADNKAINSLASGDIISSWGSGATINAISLNNQVYSTGASALINSAGFDAINATGNNDTIHGGTYGGDNITIAGSNSLASVGLALNGNAVSSITVSGINDTVVSGSSSVASNVTVNNASVVIQVAVGAGATSVSSSVSYTAPTNVTSLTLIGTQNITATGNAGPDVLTGGAGSDTLTAGSSIDTLVGGSGNTTFVVNNSGDVVRDGFATTNNTIQSAVNFVLPTNVNNLVLTGTIALTGTANSGNDTLISNAGIDTLYGGTGNDTFVLNNAADVVIDTAGIATIVYSSSVNFTLPANVNVLTLLGTASIVATGNAGNDSITANSGADTLVAGNGNDTLVAGAGPAVDSLVGGTGNDLFVVNALGDTVTVGPVHGVDTIQSSVSYTASANVANLTLIGTASLMGTGGALAGLIVANSGNDTLIAGTGLATLVGGPGNDTFVLNNIGDVIQETASTSNNTVDVNFNYTLPAFANSLVLLGTGALVGTLNSGNDTLTSNSGIDTLIGGSGNDTFVINNSNDNVQDALTSATNSAVSSVNFSLPTNVNALTFTGTAALIGTGNSGNDVLTANSGADTLVAGSGNDTLISSNSAQAESLVGGTGNDLFVINNAADVINIGGAHGADSIQSSVSLTLPTAVNSLTLLGSANLTGAATTGANVIMGNSGNDVLKAGTGNDTLTAGSGVDTLIGGTGSDTFVVNSVLDVLQSLSATSNSIVSSISFTLPANVTSLTLTGTANLVGTGNAQADVLKANTGNDTLTAGVGVATFYSGDGNDIFVVNNASDSVVADTDGLKYGADTVESSVSYSLGAAVNTLVLTGNTNLTGIGNAYGAPYSGDLIVGNAGLDTLIAGLGQDTLMAGSGLATLVGAAGLDTFIVNNTGDIVIDSVGGYSNVLLSSVSYTLPTNVNTLSLTGSANLTAVGNSANDSLIGNAGADSLVAGPGNDTLVAGSGIDTLVGGAGADIFVISNSADVVQSASTNSGNALFSSTNYVLPTNVNRLTLTGVANVMGTGNASADTLTGGAGDDTLVAGSGIATLIAGSGNTAFVVNNASDVVRDSFTATSNSIQSSVSYTLVTNVNSLFLTGTAALAGTANSANDTLVSNTGVDTLFGGAGNDTFVVSNAADVVQDISTTAANVIQASVSYSLTPHVNTLILTGTAALVGTANAGNDTLTSNWGADTLIGGTGNETFVVNNSQDVVQQATAGTASLILAAANYTLPTNVNVLTLTGTAALVATGNAAADVITANSGNDTLSAGSGVATLVGGIGNDAFVVNNVGDVVRDSSTTATNVLQASVSTTLVANVNTLVLTGTANLTANANAANDTLISNYGIDTLVGSTGNELFIVNNAADVILNAAANDTIESSVSFAAPTGINNLQLIGSSNIAATGNGGPSVLTAGAGTDTLIAGAGVATLNGGTGNDTFIVNSAFDVVNDPTYTTNNTILSSVNYSLPTNVDALTLTGTGSLSATGNADAANILTANSGSDFLIGTAFSNTIYGGTGSDTIEAGPEVNVIYAGDGGTASQPTYVYDNFNGTNVTTQSTIYGGSGTDILYGGPGSDVIYAGTGPNSIYGGTGFDSIYGSAGSLLLDSLSGHDLLVAGGGAETLVATGSDTVVAGTGTDLLEAANGMTASEVFQFNTGFGHTTITSGSHNDTLSFGPGIKPTDFAISASTTGSAGNQTDVALIFTDGASSIVVAGGLLPGTIDSLNFADTGTETLTQFMQSQSLGTVRIPYQGNNDVLSTGNTQTIAALNSDLGVFAFGNGDVLSSGYGNGRTIYAYGANDTVTGSSVWAAGSADVVNGTVTNVGAFTVSGANDTVSVGSNSSVTVYQSSTVIQTAPGSQNDSIDAFVNFNLPTNEQSLTLDSAVGGLLAATNAQGGTLIAAGASDTLTGGAGHDVLVAQGANDVLVGGTGSETYELNSSTDSIVFGTGNASLNTVWANFSYTLPGGANTLYITGNNVAGMGNSSNDTLRSYGSGDTLAAGPGSDALFDGSYGPTTMVGGVGSDTFNVNWSGDWVIDNYGTGNNVVDASVSYTLPSNVNALLLESAYTTGTANTANDVLTDGGAGHDTFAFNSGFGNDQVLNAQNGDVIEFGSGITQGSLTFSALAGSGGATASLVISQAGGGTVTVQGGLVPGALSSILFAGGGSLTVPQALGLGRQTVAGSSGNLILTAASADSVIAGIGQDTVDAWGNSDTLTAGTGGTLINAGGTGALVTGGSGTDTLVAIGANTTLIGGAGQETFVVNDGSGSAVIQVAAGVGQDTVLSAVSYTVPTNVSVMTMTGTANVHAYGNAGNDIITANAGSDLLVAGSGVDTLIGGPGGDTFIVNNASDVVRDAYDSTNSIIQSSASFVLPANVDTLQLTGAGGISGRGNSDSQNNLSNSTSGSVTLIGGSGNDQLVAGNSGDDSLVSGSGVDTLIGGYYSTAFVINNSQDVIQRFNQYDLLTSSVSYTLTAPITNDGYNLQWNLTGSANIVASDNDGVDVSITGNSGNDTLIGGSSQNYLNAGTGIDTLVGGGVGSSNYYKVNNTSDAVIAQAGSINQVSASVNYTLPALVNQLLLEAPNIVGVDNASGSNVLLGTDYAGDTLIAGSGSDTLYSSVAGDTLIAGTGSDFFQIWGGTTVLLNAGFGNSQALVFGGTATPTVQFGAGISGGTLTASAALDANGMAALSISNGTGAVTLDGALAGQAYQFNFNGGSNLTLTQFLAQVNVTTSSVTGGSGNVILEGTTSVAVTGGSGNDTIYAAASADTISGGSGVQVLDALGANDLVIGGSNNDTLGGFGANDTLTGGSTPDVLIGGTGASVTFIINSTGNTIQVQSSPGPDTVQSSVAFSLPTGINTLVLTGTSSIKGTANSGADTLVSNSGASDTLAGGTGADLFVVNSSTDVVSVGSTHGVDTIQSSASYINAVNVAKLILTGTVALSGTGTTTASLITANSGADTLAAGTAVVTLIGGAGNDTFVINNASDVVQDTTTTTANVLSSSVSYTLPTNINRLILTGTANVTGTANSANDTLSANGGTDTLISGTGVDSLVGGSGNDTFVINNAGDVVIDTSTTTTNLASSSVSFALPTNVNRLVLTGTAALVGTANSANDTLAANSGADTLISGTGVDSLVGGTGADLFLVNNTVDIVNVGTSHGVDTIRSSVSFTNAANVAYLVLTGSGAVTGTGSTTTASQIIANSGTDTLSAGTAVVTLIGGAGNDTFVINNTNDVVQDTVTTTSNVLSSSVSYTLPTNVNRLILTGTGALVGTANNANDTLTANTGADTLVSGTGVDSLVGGTGANLFVVNNVSDIVNVGATHGVDTIQSSVSYTASANVANLTLTGTSALVGTGNSLAGTIKANTGNDTLVAGSGADTLVGGSGTDVFVVNSASDIVSLGTSGTSDTIQSSALTYTLPTNVQYLMLTGTAALAGTGNSALSLVTGNSGNDTLTGGSGIAALEGGKTGGSDQIKAIGNQAALIAGGGSSTLTGGAFKDFYAAGKVSDSITTGATSNVISVNKGDGATALQPTTSATNVLSLGAGIDTESLFFTKTGNNLVLTDGVSGDSITFTNWYVGAADQVVKTLQVVEIASANYNSAGSDGLRNKALEAFNFTTLVNAYNTAGSPANWALSTAMPSAQLASSSTADYGGDLAYYFGLNGNLTGVNLSAVQATLTNASFATATQTIDPFASISGGGGLNLLSIKTGSAAASVALPVSSSQAVATTTSSSDASSITPLSAPIAAHDAPTLRSDVVSSTDGDRRLTPHYGFEVEMRGRWRSFTTVTAADATAALTGLGANFEMDRVGRSRSFPAAPKSYVDPINLAWLTMHETINRIGSVARGAESIAEHDVLGHEMLLAGEPLGHVRRGVTDPNAHLPIPRERAL